MITDDASDLIAKDIAALQQEMARLRKTIAARGSHAYDALSERADKVYDAAAPRARATLTRLRSEGVAASEAAGEHAAATTAALAFAAALGFLAGYLVGTRSEPQPHSWWPH